MRKLALASTLAVLVAGCGSSGGGSQPRKTKAVAEAKTTLRCFERASDPTWLVSASQTDQSGEESDRLVAVEFTLRHGTGVVDVAVTFADDAAAAARRERSQRAELASIHTPPRLVPKLLVRRGRALALWGAVPTPRLTHLLNACLRGPA